MIRKGLGALPPPPFGRLPRDIYEQRIQGRRASVSPVQKYPGVNGPRGPEGRSPFFPTEHPFRKRVQVESGGRRSAVASPPPIGQHASGKRGPEPRQAAVRSESQGGDFVYVLEHGG